MKICIIGEHSPHLYEAMISTAFCLAEKLSKHHEVLFSNLLDIRSRNFWREIRVFKPQIIHYIPGPSIISFAITKALSLYCRDARIVMSALHPSIPLPLRIFIPLLKPDLILTQSNETEQMFSRLGCRTVFLPSGINTEKFKPISEEAKATLREKYGLDKEKFTVLHVGHFLKRRGLAIFEEVKGENNQVVIAGSPYGKPEKEVYQKLEEAGCVVFRDYLENIEEIYALSDCYLFPTVNKIGSIETPFSVLEAMACNLPVISTRFGALPRMFEHGDGLVFVNDIDDFIPQLEEIKKGKGIMEIHTRGKVLPLSWERVVEQLEEIYNDLVSPG